MRVVALEIIAHSTGEPEVFLIVGTTPSSWDQMIDLNWRENVALRTLAIPAPIPGLRTNTGA
jgi:hypothetical protein